MIFINCTFTLVELIVSIVVVRSFLRTQSAAFYLRTAPLIDKLFSKIYANSEDINSKRVVQIGMQRFDKQFDNQHPFKESDRMLADINKKTQVRQA
jgi:hypothetical protein